MRTQHAGHIYCSHIPSVVAKDGIEQLAVKHGVDLVITSGASCESELINSWELSNNMGLC
jgi:hypothetical protein